MQRQLLISVVKMTGVAIEQSAEKHADYVVRIGPYAHQQLVFVDESTCDWHTMFRGCAWAVLGQHAVCKAFFVHGKR
jgi:hypothetical protein